MKATVILFKALGKYYTEEEWEIPARAIGPYDMAASPDFRRIDNGPVLVLSQHPWGYPCLLLANNSSTGAELILAERRRVLTEEGFTQAMDTRYTQGELIQAAVAYINTDQTLWPLRWSPEMFKLTPDDRIRELTKAGQFIAAEIDRLKRV